MSTNRPAPPPPTRRAAEQRSAVPLLYLRHLPAWVVPVALVALLVAGLALRGWPGTVALGVVAAFLSWLAYLSWPGLGGGGRLGRAAVVVALLGAAALQATR